MSAYPERLDGEQIRRIEGTITLVDGSTHEFSIDAMDGRHSWGATWSVLSLTSETLDRIVTLLRDDEVIATPTEIERYERDREDDH